MKKEVGSRHCEIWLLGDSNPKNWQDVLETPFDPRHPARHNIWTPVLDVIQDGVFRASRRRLDTSLIYMRNAVEDRDDKPSAQSHKWGTRVETEVQEFREILLEYNLKILFSFGAFSFEFARRALCQEPGRSHGYWGSERLGNEFRQRMSRFDLDHTNLLPLLHVSIARQFLRSHELFCAQKGANYFEFVGNHVTERLIENQGALQIWVW